MFRQVVDVADVVHARNAGGHCDDFFVVFAIVNHLHHTNHFSGDNAQGHHVDFGKYRNIQWIVVFAVNSGNETIIVRVLHHRVYHPVEAEQVTLNRVRTWPEAPGYFDDGTPMVSTFLSWVHVVPRVKFMVQANLNRLGECLVYSRSGGFLMRTGFITTPLVYELTHSPCKNVGVAGLEPAASTSRT